VAPAILTLTARLALAIVGVTISREEKIMSVSQLAYLGIGVSDMPAWKSFATDILGMQATERGDDGTVYLRMDENHHRIALHPSGEDDVL
jgi:catechol-2,3-dioxygenase